MTRRRLSGSSRSPSAVELVTSEKRTVTILRVSAPGACVTRTEPAVSAHVRTSQYSGASVRRRQGRLGRELDNGKAKNDSRQPQSKGDRPWQRRRLTSSRSLAT